MDIITEIENKGFIVNLTSYTVYNGVQTTRTFFKKGNDILLVLVGADNSVKIDKNNKVLFEGRAMEALNNIQSILKTTNE